MENKVQRQIVDYFTFFEEYHNIVKTSLKDCQRFAISINKLITRCKNVREACLTDTPLENFPNIQSKICAKLHNLISLEVQEIRVHLYKLEDLFEKLNNKYKVLRQSCHQIDFTVETPLVKGTSLQPSLKHIIEFAEDTLNFASQVCAQIDVTLNVLVIKQDHIPIDNLKIEPNWQRRISEIIAYTSFCNENEV